MAQIIKFTDVNVDGYGTDIVTYIQVEGRRLLTIEIIDNVNDIIERYKSENDEWDTDGVLCAACEYLKAQNYECCPVTPEFEIEF